jgi:hypothetical protein
MAGREIVNRQVNIYIQSGEAQKAYDTLIKKEKLLNDEIAKTTDSKRLTKLKDDLNKLQEPITRAAKKVSGELAPSFRDLEAATRKFLAEFKRTGDPAALANFSKFNAALKDAKTNIDAASVSQNKLDKKGIFSAAFWASLASGVVVRATSMISGFLQSSIEEALQADENARKLKSTLDNLGQGDSFDRITRKAQEMANKFKFLDNDDVVAVFNQLIDYGKLTEKQMNQLLPVIVNFASKSGLSLKEATSVVVKALNGSGKALKEYGINIKDSSSQAENFNTIMTTLKQKTDGAAEAFQNSARGGIAEAKQTFSDLKEEVGNGLIPILSKLLSVANEVVKGLTLILGLRSPLKQMIDGFQKGDASVQEQSGKNTNTLKGQLVDFLKLGTGITPNKDEDIDAYIVRARKENAKAEALVQEFLIARKKRLAEAEATVGQISAEGIFSGGDKNKVDLAKDINAEILSLHQVIDSLEASGKTLGIPSADSPEVKSNANKLKELLKGILDFGKMFSEENRSDIQKDFDQLNEKFKELRDAIGNNRELQLKLEEAYQIGQDELREKWAKKELERQGKLQKDREKKLKEAATVAMSLFAKYLEFIKTLETQQRENSFARLENAVLNTSGQERLNFQKTLLIKQRDQEIDETIKKYRLINETREQTEIRIQDILKGIRLKYNDEEEKLDQDFYLGRINAVLDFAKQVSSVFETLSQSQTNRENAELERDRTLNDRKKRNLEVRLKSGVLTQQQYQRELDKIGSDQEKKEKAFQLRQFKRNQRIAITQAIINGAQGIISTFAARPGLADIFTLGTARAIQIALIAATTAAEIGAISSQKPQFAKGGKLGGSLHSEGGNPIIDGRTGRKIAEIEHGEGIINRHTMNDRSRYSVYGTPSQIASALNGMHGVSWAAGARLVPAWGSTKALPFNFSGIQKHYASGGRFNTSSITTGGSNTADPQLLETMQMMTSLLASLQVNGIKAYTLLTDHEKQQARLNSIRDDATLK